MVVWSTATCRSFSDISNWQVESGDKSPHSKSKVEDDLFLHAILARRERIQWHKEVGKVSAVAQFGLDKQQALQRHLLRQSVIEAKMIGANVDAAIGSQIIVSDLGNQSVRAFG